MTGLIKLRRDIIAKSKDHSVESLLRDINEDIKTLQFEEEEEDEYDDDDCGEEYEHGLLVYRCFVV